MSEGVGRLAALRSCVFVVLRCGRYAFRTGRLRLQKNTKKAITKKKVKKCSSTDEMRANLLQAYFGWRRGGSFKSTSVGGPDWEQGGRDEPLPHHCIIASLHCTTNACVVPLFHCSSIVPCTCNIVLHRSLVRCVVMSCHSLATHSAQPQTYIQWISLRPLFVSSSSSK